MNRLTITVDGKTYFSLPRVLKILSIRKLTLDQLIADRKLTPIQFRTNGAIYISQAEISAYFKASDEQKSK